jgi:hypothetical protein
MNNMGEFSEGVAWLAFKGQHVGSAWLVAPDLVCTANHCVVDCELNAAVELQFQSASTTGTVIEKNSDLDIALIQIDATAHSIAPLELIARPIQLTASTRWQLHGYPVEHAEYHEGGLSLNGHIDNARTGSAASPLMQLSCNQGLTTGDGQPAQSPFGGISGCPVVVRPRDNEDQTFVIGVIVHHHTAQDNILYCTPIDEVVSRHSAHFAGTQLKSWDATRKILIVGRGENGFRTNLDAHLIKNLWQDGLTGLWCNLLPDELPVLTSAIERIVVQSPFARATPNTDLHFKGADAWKSRCERCTMDWVPVEESTIKTTLGKYSFVELVDDWLPHGGEHFDDLAELANHVRGLCNQWAFERLRVRIIETFDNPVGELKYNIAPDVLVAMQKLWTDWIEVFSKDPETLHHFIGLMLSCDGGVLMADSAAGTGPETIDRCVLHATVFAMALCVALPEKLQTPKGNSPGNLGRDEMSGHSSGIQTLSGLTLRMADRSHKWKTPFVMLPHLQVAWEVYRVGESRLDKEVSESSQSLIHEPASSFVLPSDIELLGAIADSLVSLKALLSDRYTEFLSAQERYVTEAKNVNV